MACGFTYYTPEKHLASRNGSIQSADDGIVDSDDRTVTWPSRQLVSVKQT